MNKWIAGVGILISLLLLVWILSRSDVHGAMDHVHRLGWTHWLAGAAIYLCAFLPRGLRWKLMLPDSNRLPSGCATRIVVIGYAANNVLPFRLPAWC